MKKYVLVKAYPGSLEVGTEVVWGSHGLSGDCYQAKVKAGIFRFGKDTIEKNPEFWQEVKELDYEIQSFKYSNVIYTKTGEGFRCRGGIISHNLESHLSDGVSKVHSVKRLSDGLVITVGDTVVTKNVLTTEVVTGFRFNDGKTSFKEGLWVTIKNGGMHLERIKEVRKPLFTTEDGVKIFEGSTYWCVNTAPHLWSLFEQTAKERTQLNKTVKAFSTEQLAETYVKRNQPRMSIEDCLKIRDAWHSNRIGLEESIREYLKQNDK